MHGQRWGAGEYVRSIAEPVALLAYAAPVAVATVVAVLLEVFVPGPRQTVVTNGALQPIGLSPALIVASLVALVLLFVADGFGAGAAAVAIGARLRGERPTLSASWRRALRRLPAVLVTRLVIALLLGFLLAVVLTAIRLSGTGVGIFVLLVAIVIAIVFIPLVLAPSIAVLGDDGPGRSIGLAFRSVGGAGAPNSRPGLVAVVVLGAGVVAGSRLLLTLLPSTIPWTTLADVVTGVVVLAAGVVVIGSLAGRALLVPSGRFVDAETSATRPHRGRPAIAVTAVVAAVLPSALLGGLLVTGVGGQADIAQASAGNAFQSVALVAPGDDGAVVLSDNTASSHKLSVCTPTSCRATELEIAGTAAIAADGDRVLVANWGFPSLDSTHSSLTIASTTTDALAARSRPAPRHELDAVDFAEHPDVQDFRWGHRLAIATGAHGTVVASLSPAAKGKGHDAEVFGLYRCTTVDCATGATRSSVPLTWDGLLNSGYASLDVAQAPDGTAFASVVSEAKADPLRLMVVAPDGAISTRVLESSLPYASTTGNNTQAAQVAVGADGLADVLFQRDRTSEFTLFHCTDAACSHWTTRRVALPHDDFVTPALAIDTSGRPMFAGFDAGTSAVVLESCDDASCSSRHTRTLGAFQGGYGDTGHRIIALALDLDGRGRPVVVAMATVNDLPLGKELSRVFHCQQARCGAP